MTCDASDPIAKNTLRTLQEVGAADDVEEFTSADEIKKRFIMLDGPMENDMGYFNPAAVFP
jgi:hypothetical protein